MPELLRADVADQVRGGVGVSVDVAVEAGDPQTGLQTAPIRGGVELLLGKRSDQQPQAFELFRVQEAIEQPVVVGDGHDLPLRHVAQVGSRRQVDRRGKLRQKMLGQVEVQVEARQITALLTLDLVDVMFGEQHAALRVIRMRQREKAFRPQALFADLLGRHGRQFFPGLHARRQLHPDALLDRFAPRHGHAASGAIAQVVALGEQLHLSLHDLGLRGLHALNNVLEILGDDHRGIAGRPALSGFEGHGSQRRRADHKNHKNRQRDSTTKDSTVIHDPVLPLS